MREDEERWETPRRREGGYGVKDVVHVPEQDISSILNSIMKGNSLSYLSTTTGDSACIHYEDNRLRVRHMRLERSA